MCAMDPQNPTPKTPARHEAQTGACARVRAHARAPFLSNGVDEHCRRACAFDPAPPQDCPAARSWRGCEDKDCDPRSCPPPGSCPSPGRKARADAWRKRPAPARGTRIAALPGHSAPRPLTGNTRPTPGDNHAGAHVSPHPRTRSHRNCKLRHKHDAAGLRVLHGQKPAREVEPHRKQQHAHNHDSQIQASPPENARQSPLAAS